jgi:hypothetical protein
MRPTVSSLCAAVCAATLSLTVPPVVASTPASHSVVAPTTAGQSVVFEWTGTAPPGANPTSACTLPMGGFGEDHHGITLSVPAGAYDAVDVKAEFSIRWEEGSSAVVATDPDLILTIKRDGAEVDSSDGGDPSETVVLTNPAPGALDAVSCAFLASGATAYAGSLTLTATAKGDSIGCTGCQYPGIRTAPTESRAVVAVIDSAINPYHGFYHAPERSGGITQEILRDLGVKPENVLTLTRTGSMPADLAADEAKWAGVKPGELYHFAGTNIVAISFAGQDGAGNDHPPLKPVWYPGDDPRNKNPHGTGTSASVLNANPDAVILFVETEGDLGNNAAHEFVLRHPAVDILTTSYGIAIAGVVGVLPETRTFHETYAGVVQRGKLHFTSAGNNPGLDPLTGGAGPWWSIGVSGVEEDKPSFTEEDDAQGQQVMSGNMADIVGDYTQQLPYCLGGTFDADGFEDPAGTVDCQSAITPNVPGTSFSSPRSAGVASRVLLEARRRMGHVGGIRVYADRTAMAVADTKELGNWQLRRALEQAAWIPQATDWAPFGFVTWEVTSLPVNPAAPWLQVGWGEMTTNPDKGVISGALAHLGFVGTPVTKAAGFCEYQTELVLQRKRYWDEIAPQIPFNYTSNDGSSGAAGAPDPFVYCASAAPHHPASNDTGGQATLTDADGDGVLDPSDNCSGVPNAAQGNADDDAAGDACDADDDNDLVADASDNCPYAANASQTDTDGDGFGDACDAPTTSGRDRDGDGISDKQDNCFKVPNPDQADADGDGKGDACDKR